MDIDDEEQIKLSYAMFWCVTFTRDSTHAFRPTTYHDMYFKNEESVQKYMDSIPEEKRFWYRVTEVLALKQIRPGQEPRYFPLGKPIVFRSEN